MIDLSTVTLKAADGHMFSAYVCSPPNPRGGLVVLQEIFGVNRHIRSLCERFAGEGYLAVAPALYDRLERNVELTGYSDEDIARGRALRAASSLEACLQDIAVCRDTAALAGKVGVIGYCWGGMLAWASALRIEGFSACVSYYGGGIAALGGAPAVPTIAHFGERDKLIPVSDVLALRASCPEVSVHLYPADHGFNCDLRSSFDPASAALALSRTMALFEAQVASG